MSATRTTATSATTANAVRAFLDHVEQDRLAADYMLACTTGMRRGEVLALRWQDVDLDTQRVSVSRSLTVVGGYKCTSQSRRRHVDGA